MLQNVIDLNWEILKSHKMHATLKFTVICQIRRKILHGPKIVFYAEKK